MVTEFTISDRLHGRQWKSILQSELGMSRRLLRQFARDNSLLVNGIPVYLTSRATSGDVLTVALPTESSNVAPEPGPLAIAYEDDEIVVVNKPPGILTHPSARESSGSLLARVANYLKPSGQVPHAVHRLDRDTSGLVMVAKHAHFHHLFDHALQAGLVHRTYIAIVRSPANHRFATGVWHSIDLPVAADPDAPSKRVIHETGQRAVTHYQAIAQAGDYTLVGVILETGRTHQIRIHFAEIGCPLAGEPHYQTGQSRENPAAHLLNRRPPKSIRRQALHAVALKWQHPLTGQSHVATAEAPNDMVEFWQQVGGNLQDFEFAEQLSDAPFVGLKKQ